MVRRAGAEYFDPDAAARRIRARRPGLGETEASALAWQIGRRLLERAIATRATFAFETTLGGNTIPGLLGRAAAEGLQVRVWYVGLASPELHLARVRARVARGGHDIPEARIRARYDASRLNLVRLLPALTEARVYDNSAEADPHAGGVPEPALVLHWARGRIVRACPPAATPGWAKPIVAAALRATAAKGGPAAASPRRAR
jgi:predicted ABC-type ATPase